MSEDLTEALKISLALAPAFLILWFVFKAGGWYERARTRRESCKAQMTDAQQSFIGDLCLPVDRPLPPNLAGLTRVGASLVIVWLVEKRDNFEGRDVP